MPGKIYKNYENILLSLLSVKIGLKELKDENYP